MYSVRGMGVAVSVSTSTAVRRRLDALLVGDAEAVLLVDHQEAQVLERDVLGQEAMGADHDVHGAARESLDDRLLLLGAPEAREQLHARRETARTAR